LAWTGQNVDWELDLAAGETLNGDGGALELPQTHRWSYSNQNEMVNLQGTAPPLDGHRSIIVDDELRRRTAIKC
jgi:hypothetical protein